MVEEKKKEEVIEEKSEEVVEEKQSSKQSEEKEDALSPKEEKEIREGVPFAILAYFGPLCLIPLFVKKKNRFAAFHTRQGLVLFIGEVGGLIINIIPLLGQIICLVVFLVCGVFSLIGIVQALFGKYWDMPIVTKVAAKFKI